MEYAQSFIKHRTRCGLILKRLKTETPSEEHFIPFRAYLGMNYKNKIDTGLVGDEFDATSIIKGAGAETEIDEMVEAQIKRERAQLEAKEERLLEKKSKTKSKEKVDKKTTIKKEKQIETTTRAGRKVKIKREKLDDDSSLEELSSNEDDDD